MATQFRQIRSVDFKTNTVILSGDTTPVRVADHCADHLEVGRQVLLVDGLIIAVVTDSIAKKYAPNELIIYDKTLVKLLQDINTALTFISIKNLDFSIGEYFSIKSNTLDKCTRLAMKLNNISLESRTEYLSIAIGGLGELKYENAKASFLLNSSFTLGTGDLEVTGTNLSAVYSALNAKLANIVLKSSSAQVVIDTLSGFINNINIESKKIKVNATAGDISISATSSTDIASGGNVTVSSGLGSVNTSALHSVNIGVGQPIIPLPGYITLSSPVTHVNSPVVMLTSTPMMHTANAEPLIQVLTQFFTELSTIFDTLGSALNAVVPGTGAAFNAYASLLNQKTGTLSAVLNPKVMQ